MGHAGAEVFAVGDARVELMAITKDGFEGLGNGFVEEFRCFAVIFPFHIRYPQVFAVIGPELKRLEKKE